MSVVGVCGKEAVPDKEDGRVVPHQVPIALLRVELHGEAPRISEHDLIITVWRHGSIHRINGMVFHVAKDNVCIQVVEHEAVHVAVHEVVHVTVHLAIHEVIHVVASIRYTRQHTWLA